MSEKITLLKLVFEHRESKQRIDMAGVIVGKVTYPKINEAMEKLTKEIREIDNKYNLYHYDPLVTDEEIIAYCWKCKKEVKTFRVYGFQSELPCPHCESEVSTASMECYNCPKKGTMWLYNSVGVHEELVVDHYKCVKCGATASEPID